VVAIVLLVGSLTVERTVVTGEAHPFFLQDKFIAVSHEGVKEDGEITVEGFRRARELGIIYMETDVGLNLNEKLVAAHKKPSVETRGGVLVEELLDIPDTRWNFEINNDDTKILEALADILDREGMNERVCIHFGTSSRSEAAAARSKLPDGTCFCSTLQQRLGTADLAPARWVASLIKDSDIGPVNCLVTSDLTADARDLNAAPGALVLSWPTTAKSDTRARMKSLICDGFSGIMTDDPEALKAVLVELGMWSDDGPPDASIPLDKLGEC
jgi:hypothetical protein